MPGAFGRMPGALERFFETRTPGIAWNKSQLQPEKYYLSPLNSCLSLVMSLERGAYPENSHILHCHIRLAFLFNRLFVWILFQRASSHPCFRFFCTILEELFGQSVNISCCQYCMIIHSVSPGRESTKSKYLEWKPQVFAQLLVLFKMC